MAAGRWEASRPAGCGEPIWPLPLPLELRLLNDHETQVECFRRFQPQEVLNFHLVIHFGAAPNEFGPAGGPTNRVGPDEYPAGVYSCICDCVCNG